MLFMIWLFFFFFFCQFYLLAPNLLPSILQLCRTFCLSPKWPCFLLPPGISTFWYLPQTIPTYSPFLLILWDFAITSSRKSSWIFQSWISGNGVSHRQCFFSCSPSWRVSPPLGGNKRGSTEPQYSYYIFFSLQNRVDCSVPWTFQNHEQ